MATIPQTTIRAPEVPSMNVWATTWNLGDDDVGQPVALSGASDRSVQVEGTFAGATVNIMGSNDGSNYHPLSDPQGNPLTWTSANRIEAVSELTRFLRAESSGGSGTAVVVTLASKGSTI